MTDDEKPPATTDDLLWETLPREARTFVYEHLREGMAQARKIAQMATISRRLSGLDNDPGAIEATQHLLAVAFANALDELEMVDPDICQECGGYHDEDAPAKHVDPKDLS